METLRKLKEHCQNSECFTCKLFIPSQPYGEGGCALGIPASWMLDAAKEAIEQIVKDAE